MVKHTHCIYSSNLRSICNSCIYFAYVFSPFSLVLNKSSNNFTNPGYPSDFLFDQRLFELYWCISPSSYRLNVPSCLKSTLNPHHFPNCVWHTCVEGYEVTSSFFSRQLLLQHELYSVCCLLNIPTRLPPPKSTPLE